MRMQHTVHVERRTPRGGGNAGTSRCAPAAPPRSFASRGSLIPVFRHIPPVYSAIGPSALWRAALDQLGNGAPQLRLAARDRLGRLYPDREITLTDSGTSSLLLALRLTLPAVGQAPLVALPAYACPDVGAAAVGAGYRIMLYDTNPETLCPDLSSLRRCLDAGCSHVVAVHLFGWIVDVGAVIELARPYGALVIEDAAQQAGGTKGGVRGGALADWSILSFGRGKGFNAGGGGALLQRASACPVSMADGDAPVGSGVALAKAVAGELLSRPWLYWLPTAVPSLRLGETMFHAAGVPRAISATSAALLLEAIGREAGDVTARRLTETRYAEALADARGVRLSRAAADMHSGALRYPVRLPPEIGLPLRALGVARSYPRTLAQYRELTAHIEARSEPLHGAAELASSLHTLPTHSRVRRNDIDRIIAQLTPRR